MSRRGLLLAAQNVGRIGLLFGAIVTLGLVRTFLPVYVYATGVGAALAAIYVAGRHAEFRWWAWYVGGFVAFAYLRTLADETGIPWRFDYVIALERALALGTLPTVWLQERLYTFGSIGVIDRLLYAVYASYFFAAHLGAVLVWRSGPSRFRLYVTAILGTFYAGLLVSYLLPTAPPWLAGQTGHLPHVFRIMLDLTSGVSPEADRLGYAVAGSNPVAAMPSLHMAITVIVACFMWRHHVIAGVAGALYSAAMALSLVYLGEHYVVDLLAGVLVAAVAWKLANRVCAPGSGSRATDPAPLGGGNQGGG